MITQRRRVDILSDSSVTPGESPAQGAAVRIHGTKYDTVLIYVQSDRKKQVGIEFEQVRTAAVSTHLFPALYNNGLLLQFVHDLVYGHEADFQAPGYAGLVNGAVALYILQHLSVLCCNHTHPCILQRDCITAHVINTVF